MASDNAPLPPPLLNDALPPDHRSGYVALVGKPNVGKSTLLNAWLGYRLMAVSPKPQTTRNALLGILTRPDAQVIFVDTPGVHTPRSKLGEYMVQSARRALPDADVVLWLVDLAGPPDALDEQVAALVGALEDTPVLMALNKADLAAPGALAERFAAYQALGDFPAAAVSALTGAGLPELLESVVARLPQGPRYYPEDQLSDQQERFIASELVREAVMRLLEYEVPYASAVLVNEFKERENGVLFIAATIYTERDSQKGIVIGRGGAMLKRIGSLARANLEEMFGTRVYLELWVKVHKNWRSDAQALRDLGYSTRR
ncbi:MAG: GTPase Era [Chloroflexota bacterium]